MRPGGLNHEPTLLLRRARIHVAAAIEVVVDFRRRADHPAIEEHIEARGLQVFFAQNARAIVLPKNSEQERCDHRIDVDAEHVARRTGVVQRLNKLAVESVKGVVVAALRHELGDEALARIVIDGLAFEDRVVNPGGTKPDSCSLRGKRLGPAPVFS
jgi:hypothetical protein